MDPLVNSSDDLALIKLLIDALTSNSATDLRNPCFMNHESGSVRSISPDRSSSAVCDKCFPESILAATTSVTTLMIRNIPRKCTQRMLVADMTAAGFAETFDFCYLPTDISSAKNLGYAFVNFTHPDYALSFREVFHKKHLACMQGSRTGLSVSPAVIQGYQANIDNVMKNASVHRIRNPEYLPLIIHRDTGRLGPCIMEMDIKRRHSNSSQASTVSFASLQDWSFAPESVVDGFKVGELKAH